MIIWSQDKVWGSILGTFEEGALTFTGLGLPLLVGTQLQVFRLLGQHGSRANPDRAEVHAGRLDADAHTQAPIRPLHQVAFTCRGQSSSREGGAGHQIQK